VKSRERNLQYGRVIFHSKALTIQQAKPNVSERGRQRVLKEGRKNVHAGFVGDLIDIRPLSGAPVDPDSYLAENLVGISLQFITYDPYRYSGFVDVDTRELISNESNYRVIFLPDKRVAVQRLPYI